MLCDAWQCLVVIRGCSVLMFLDPEQSFLGWRPPQCNRGDAVNKECGKPIHISELFPCAIVHGWPVAVVN